MNPLSRLFASALAMALVAGCQVDRSAPDGFSAGTGSSGAEGAGGSLGPGCAEPEEGCFSHEVRLSEIRRDLYLVVDHSASMSQEFSVVSRWEVARAIIVDLADRYGGRTRMGVTMFPPPGTECQPGNEILSLELSEGADPVALAATLFHLLDVNPSGSTPLATTLAKLAKSPPKIGPNGQLLVLTDGLLNCDSESCVGDACATHPAVQAVEAFREKVPVPVTFVAIQPEPEDIDLLVALGFAGGAPPTSRDPFLPADDPEALAATLDAQLAPYADLCKVDLEVAPSDPDALDVYFDCSLVPRSPDDGWTWEGPATLRFHGSACEALERDRVTTIRALEHCSGDPEHPG